MAQIVFQRFKDLEQSRISRRVRNRTMEAEVKVMGNVTVQRCLLEAFELLFHALHVFGPTPYCSQVGALRFHDESQFESVKKMVQCGSIACKWHDRHGLLIGTHEGARATNGFNQMLIAQPAQRLPDDRS